MDAPESTARATDWTKTKLGESCDVSVLRATLVEEWPKGTWSVSLYPRKGVTLGGRDWTVQLATLPVQGEVQDQARRRAIAAAEQWLAANLDRLLT